MALGWIEHGVMAFVGSACEGQVGANRSCCFEPPGYPKFIFESVAMLLRMGVIREWDTSWDRPKAVSPLNKCLVFPRFKYDNIAMVDEVFDLNDWLFTFDMKDGYRHCDLHSAIWEYMCFAWCMRLCSCPLVVSLLAGCLLR